MDKFVLNVPKWQGELVFSKEVLIFLGVILLLVVGILFCFWGYKFFRTILFMGIGTAACYGSYLLVEPMTDNPVIRMFLTVSLTFFGVCFVYFLDIIWGFILDKLRIRTALGKRTYLFAAPLGAAILGLTIYFMIWRDEIAAGGIAAVCLVIGLVFQHSKRKKQVRFKSYDDLLKLSRPEFGEDGLEFISMEPAKAAMAAAAAKPKAETAGAETVEPEVTESGLEFVELNEDEPELEFIELLEDEPEAVEAVEPAVLEAEPEAVEVVEPAVLEVEAEAVEAIEPAVLEAEPEAVEAVEPAVLEAEAETVEAVEPAVLEAEPEAAEIIVPTVFVPEPEPEFIKPAAFEPEIQFVGQAAFASEPESEPESVKPAAFEPETKFVELAALGAKAKAAAPAAPGPAPEEKPVEPVKAVAPGPAPEVKLIELVKPAVPEPAPEIKPVETVQPVALKPTKISIRMDAAASEIEVDILEDAHFLKQININTKNVASADSEPNRHKGISSYLGKIADINRHEQNTDKEQDKKPEWKLTGGVALMAFGLGFLFANKSSKGGD